MIVDLSPARCAIIAAATEAMFDSKNPSVLTPTLDPRLTNDWQIVSWITAKNALLGLQNIFGETVYFGFEAVSRVDPMQFLRSWRGTEMPKEWFEDFEAALIPCPLGGMVHGGFWSIYASASLTHPVTRPPLAAVHRVGHSLGAPLAIYDAVAGAQRGEVTSASLFACPKPGDSTFAHAADKALGTGCQVWNYTRDIVPNQPPSLPFGLGFQPPVNVNWLKPSTAPNVKIKDDVDCAHSPISYAALLGAGVQSNCITRSP